jgi:hypothetical protein
LTVSRYRDRHTAIPAYVTTSLRFDEAVFRELRYQAIRRRVPVALIVREAVDRYLGRGDDAPHRPFGEDPADAFLAAIESPAAGESVNHDHHLYGWPKEVAFEVMERLGLPEAFSFDRDFRDCGYSLVPRARRPPGMEPPESPAAEGSPDGLLDTRVPHA